MCDNLLNKLRVGLYKTGNGQGNWFQKVESRLDLWAAHGQPTCSVLGTVKISLGLCELDQNRPYVVCLNC